MFACKCCRCFCWGLSRWLPQIQRWSPTSPWRLPKPAPWSQGLCAGQVPAISGMASSGHLGHLNLSHGQPIHCVVEICNWGYQVLYFDMIYILMSACFPVVFAGSGSQWHWVEQCTIVDGYLGGGLWPHDLTGRLIASLSWNLQNAISCWFCWWHFHCEFFTLSSHCYLLILFWIIMTTRTPPLLFNTWCFVIVIYYMKPMIWKQRPLMFSTQWCPSSFSSSSSFWSSSHSTMTSRDRILRSNIVVVVVVACWLLLLLLALSVGCCLLVVVFFKLRDIK